jgi:hypothetical protein
VFWSVQTLRVIEVKTDYEEGNLEAHVSFEELEYHAINVST